MLNSRIRTTRLALLAATLAIGAFAYPGTADAQYYQRWGHPGWHQRWPGTCWNCGFLPGVAVGVGIGSLATAPYAYRPYYYATPTYYSAPTYYAAPYPYYYGNYYGWDNLYPELEPGYVPPGSG